MNSGNRIVWARFPFGDPPSSQLTGSEQHTRLMNRFYWGRYSPTPEDLDRLRSMHPEMDPARPDWQRIRADLLAAGVMPNELLYIRSADLVAMAYGRGKAETVSFDIQSRRLEDFQKEIIRELGRDDPQTAVQLMANMRCSKDTLYGKKGIGGLTELKKWGFVTHSKSLGGYSLTESGRKQT